MSFKIEDGRLTITMMYKATQPSEVPYASQSASVAVGLEFPVKGDSEKVLDSAEGFEQELQAHCVFAVANALGLEAEMRDDGTAELRFKQVAAVQQSSGGGASSKGGGGGGNRPSAPQIEVDFGNGRRKYYDYRTAKASGGYGANRPDFVAVDDDDDALWLMDRSGKEKRYMSVALANASAPVASDDTAPF